MERDFNTIIPVEKSLISRLLQDHKGQDFYEIYDQINPNDFHDQLCSNIYSIIEQVLVHESGKMDIAIVLSKATSQEVQLIIKKLHAAKFGQAINLSQSVEQITNASKMRSLLGIGHRLVQTIEHGNEETETIIDRFERDLFAISEHRSDSFVRPIDCIDDTIKSIQARSGGKILGTPSYLKKLDDMVCGFEEGNMIIIAGRPSAGKSLFALQILIENAKQGKAVGFFNLDMTKEMLMMRLASYMTMIPMHKLKSGALNQRELDWFMGVVPEIKKLDILMDSKGTLSPQEFISRSRRMKMRYPNLGILCVDYIQLMKSSGKQSRNDEIAYISSVVKATAKDIGVPVIVVSQLSRKVEDRPDKRPLMSDLRECVIGGTKVLLDNGQHVSIKSIVGKQKMVASMNKNNKTTYALSDAIWNVGCKDAICISTNIGKQITCSKKHRIKTFTGWKESKDIVLGDYVAISRNLPEPQNPQNMPMHEIILLAHMIGDGSYLKRYAIRYTSKDLDHINIVKKSAESFGNIKTKLYRYDTWQQLTMSSIRSRKNNITQWFKKLGIYDQRSCEKVIPNHVFQMDNKHIAVFIKHLFCTDGSVNPKKNLIYYATGSKKLSFDVSNLLLRFGIIGRIKAVYNKKYNKYLYHVIITGGDVIKYYNDIGIFGPKNLILIDVIAAMSNTKRNTNIDIIPKGIWRYIRNKLSELQISHRQFAKLLNMSYCGATLFRSNISRNRLAKIGNILSDQYLIDLSSNDIFWAKVVSTEQLGQKQMFDITVPDTSTWVSNGIISHNSGSLEQDADVIMLMYRDKYYNKESTIDDVEINIAKQRNGPTGVLTFPIDLPTQHIGE